MNKKGQSVLEYVIILAAIVAVIVTFASGVLKTKVASSLSHVATEMEEEVKKINF